MDRYPGRALIGALQLALLLGGSPQARAQAVDARGYWREPFIVPDPGEHSGKITEIAIDSAERFVVTGSADKSVRIWSIDDGRLLRTIRMPAGPGIIGQVNAVALSPDGSTIAVDGFEQELGTSIYLFDRTSGEVIGRIGGLATPVQDLVWSMPIRLTQTPTKSGI
jgi:WD40 repeat protein